MPHLMPKSELCPCLLCRADATWWGSGRHVQAVLCLPDVVAFCWSGGKEQERSLCLYSLKYEPLCLTSLGVHSPLFPSNELGFCSPISRLDEHCG